MSFIEKTYGQNDPALVRYVEEVFRPDTSLFERVDTRTRERDMPPIHVSPFDALHLEVLTRALGARRAVEIGTLAGFSGVALARGLAADGRLYTFEYEPRHAEVAAETFRAEGLAERVQILVGPALERLPEIERHGPFDLVFIDADKANYPGYLAWAEEHLRVGGVVLGDNAFAWGGVVSESPGEDARGIIAFNRRLAESGRFRATMLPTGEGLAMGVKLR